MKRIIFFLLTTFLLSSSTFKNAALRPNRDYALFFAVDDYQPGSGFVDLAKPIENAEAIAKELRDRYGFQTEVVKNPTLDQIGAKLREYQALFAKNPEGKYPSTGQLLIYFTGHGISEDNNGYFVPADGNIAKLYSTAFAYEIWRPFINKIDCRHILVVIDACYSVTFDPDWYNKKMDSGGFKRPGELSEGDKLLLANETDKSRIAFTSDGEEDKVPERSNFARKFLEGLQTGPRQDGILTSEGLSAYLRFAAPKPRLTEFGDDQKGSFLFVQVAGYSADDEARKAAEAAAAANLEKDLQAWKASKTANTITAYQKYLTDFPGGEFREQAQAAIRAIEQDLAIRRDDLAWQVAMEKNTAAAYQKYQTDYPQGRHRDEAATRIKALEQTVTSPPGVPAGSAADGLVLVKGGTFTMGCPGAQKDCDSDEKPAHTVKINDFYIGRHEVTQQLWKEVMGTNPSFNKDCDECPVENVNWFDVQKFIETLNKKTGQQYRLPTEAEWEYAVQGGAAGINSTSQMNSTLDQVAWYTDNSGRKTHKVGTKLHNQLGLFDMIGNVYEWCSDWYGAYSPLKQSNPAGASSSSTRVCRGGSWGDGQLSCRITNRGNNLPASRDKYIGFRLARSAQ